jgi:hypothetical protein
VAASIPADRQNQINAGRIVSLEDLLPKTINRVPPRCFNAESYLILGDLHARESPAKLSPATDPREANLFEEVPPLHRATRTPPAMGNLDGLPSNDCHLPLRLILCIGRNCMKIPFVLLVLVFGFLLAGCAEQPLITDEEYYQRHGPAPFSPDPTSHLPQTNGQGGY